MPLDLLIPPREAFACQRCGNRVRSVELTTGGIILINEEPDPNGTIIPWPSRDPIGVTQARIMNPPIPSDTRWSEHSCR